MVPLYLTVEEQRLLLSRVSRDDLGECELVNETGTAYETAKELALRKVLFEREAQASCRDILGSLTPDLFQKKPEVLGEALGKLSETDLHHVVFTVGAVGLRGILLTLLPLATKEALGDIAYLAYMRHQILQINLD